MKTNYIPPFVRSSRLDIERYFCASTNVGSVNTDSSSGLEGWLYDDEIGEWE